MFASFIAFFTPLFLMWRTLGLFLIAAALVESGFLAAASRAVWRRTAIIGLLVGLPMTPVASWMRMEIQDAPRSTVYVAATLHDLSALALAAAIVALVLLACVGRDLTPVPRAFARVGRHALTHYIGQSLILSLIASSAGMGAFGRLSRLELLLLCLPIFAFQLAFSSLWMRRFSMGPLERVWRRFTYGR